MLISKPSKRSWYGERCKVSVKKNSSSYLLGIGAPHMVLEFEFPDGKKIIAELTGREAEQFKSDVAEINLGNSHVPTWSEKVFGL